MDRHSERHHYVPRPILTNFAESAAGHKVGCFDKTDGSVRWQPPRRAAALAGYNTRGDGSAAAEEELGRSFERAAAPVVAKLVNGTAPQEIDAAGVEAIRRLLVAQTLRSPRARRNAANFLESTWWGRTGRFA